MNKLWNAEYRRIVSLRSLTTLLIGSISAAIAINLFYKSSGLYTLGITGLSMIVSSYLEGSSFDLSMSFWMIILNMPLMILAVKALGKRFTFHTILSILLVSILVRIIPRQIVLDDILLNALVGGIFFGIGVTLTLKSGGSMGGTDILSLYYSFRKEISIGQMALLMNAFVALIAGLQASVEVALYTVIASFVSSTIIDKFHTRYKKLRLEVVTDKGDQLSTEILGRIRRGITRVNVKGGYSGQDKEMLIIIITSYELVNLNRAIAKADPDAFVSVSDCKRVIGNFYRGSE
jgi:uncharacterized membrane-anchored protein YitT (DUF2179 family)